MTDEQLRLILEAIAAQGKGYPPNCEKAAIAVITCLAANQAYPVDDYPVPDGFTVVIKSHPNNAAAALVYWSTQPAPNVNMAFPLALNEAINIGLTRTGSLYVFTDTAGSQVVIAVEQRK